MTQESQHDLVIRVRRTEPGLGTSERPLAHLNGYRIVDRREHGPIDGHSMTVLIVEEARG